MIEERININLHLEDGRTRATSFKGSFKEAKKFWVGNTINMNYGTVDIRKCLSISKISQVGV